MKKQMSILFLISIFGLNILIFSSCKTPQVVVESPKVQIQTEENNFIPWHPKFYKKLGDLINSVSFYNDKEIIMEGDFFSKKYFVTNGEVHLIDTICSVEKTILLKTPGAFKIKNGQGATSPVTVNFSKVDATYEVNFLFNIRDTTFVLDPNAFLLFKGKKYPVKAKTEKNEICRIYFYSFEDKVKIEIKENAEGINQK